MLAKLGSLPQTDKFVEERVLDLGQINQLSQQRETGTRQSN
jgi:hypothetical protein